MIGGTEQPIALNPPRRTRFRAARQVYNPNRSPPPVKPTRVLNSDSKESRSRRDLFLRGTCAPMSFSGLDERSLDGERKPGYVETSGN